MEDYFEEMNGKVIKTISNGEESVYIYQFENGDVRSSDGNFFSNINDDCFDDALEEFDAEEIESVAYTEGEITTFAKPVKEFRGYTLKTTGKYNNRTGEFENA